MPHNGNTIKQMFFLLNSIKPHREANICDDNCMQTKVYLDVEISFLLSLI